MDSLRKCTAGAAGIARAVAPAATGAAIARAEAAAPLAGRAAQGAGAAVAVAVGTAMQSATVADLVATHGDKAVVAAGFARGVLSKAFTPSAELQAFFRNPTLEGLAAHPELMFQGVALLSALKHPKTGIMAGMLQQGMAAAAKGAEATVQASVQESIDRTVQEATGGIVRTVPPEVAQAATEFVKQNPAEVMKMMQLAASLR
eukprot:NODE_15023_length_1072_cov_4.535450.p2 GENE.NODE_15023_length_1072_cov_4.535450~~NODE_15023_length_1072_cov_4.535450.p2  ORF type:complete len:203 (+),score=67.58 NODE_15023_length_1072_cov_4.535450:76-684(+)